MGYFSNNLVNAPEYMTFETLPIWPEYEQQVSLAKQLSSDPFSFRCMFFHLPADQRLHLKYALINQLTNNDHVVLSVNIADFIEELLEALRQGAGCSYARYYVDSDILLVDDLQLMANKEATQETFYAHILKPRIEAGLPTVMLSECSHEELSGSLRKDLHNLLRLGLHTPSETEYDPNRR